MSNRVYLDEDGIIHNIYVGKQTRETVSDIVEQTYKLIGQLHRQHKPARILADLTAVDSQNVGARQVSWKALRKPNYQKAASFGASPQLRYIMNFVLYTSGQGERARVFDNEAEAKDWLMEK